MPDRIGCKAQQPGVIGSDCIRTQGHTGPHYGHWEWPIEPKITGRHETEEEQAARRKAAGKAREPVLCQHERGVSTTEDPYAMRCRKCGKVMPPERTETDPGPYGPGR